jgi:hypothetical protein
VLSQRTVGRFQRVLTALFTRVFYGVNAPLDEGNYYNLLYQEGIHPKLLDYLGNKYSFHPVPIARALHEGEAIDSVGRYLNSNYAVSPERARAIGDNYLLVFAAVALRQYDHLDYDQQTAYSDEIRGFLESLQQDGYSYHRGHFYDSYGNTVVPVPLSDVAAVSQPAVARKEVPQPTTEPSSPPADSRSSVTEPAMARVGRPDKPARKNWSIEAKIAFWTSAAVIIIGIATLIATVASPEVRRFFHLDNASPAASEGKPLSPALQTDKTENARQPSAALPQPPLPTSPSEKTGVRDNATVVVHRANPQSGAHTAMVATTGDGEQEIKLGAAPTRLMFTPPGLVVDKRELPKNIEVSGQKITVVRYTNSGFVINDHKHWDVRFTAYMVEGDPAQR